MTVGVRSGDRTTRAALDRRMQFLNQRYSLGLTLDKDIVGYRVVSAGNRNLSPRQSVYSTLTWLEAFEAGIEIGKEHATNEMRKGRVVE